MREQLITVAAVCVHAGESTTAIQAHANERVGATVWCVCYSQSPRGLAIGLAGARVGSSMTINRY